MRVQVRKQECEERELRYLMPRRVRRHHAAALPEVELAERLSKQHILYAMPHLYRAVQVPQHHHERHTNQSQHDGSPSRRTAENAHGIVQPPPRRPHQVVHDAVHASHREREECRHSKVERDHRLYPRRPDKHSRQELPPVVVVQVAAPEPRVIRWHDRGAQHRVQVREVHRLLAPAIRVPQVRVRHPHQHERQERRNEYQLPNQQHPPAPPHEVADLLPLERKHAKRHSSHQHHGKRDGQPRKRHPLQARQQPHHKPYQQYPQRLAQQVAPVRQRPEHHKCQRQRHQRHEFQRAQPRQHRHAVRPATRLDDLRPGATALLYRCVLGRIHQPQFRLIPRLESSFCGLAPLH